MRISDGSSDVCSSDLTRILPQPSKSTFPQCPNCLAASASLKPTRRKFSRTFSRLTLSAPLRSEEHTSELQSLMRISYAVFCLKKKNDKSLIYSHVITTINRLHNI